MSSFLARSLSNLTASHQLKLHPTRLLSTMAAPYRSYIQPEADAEFPAEAGRYHLYVTYSCPFACRALAARNLKGLQDVIGLSVAHPIYNKTKPNDPEDSHLGWTFVDPATEPTLTAVNGKTYPSDGCVPDTVNHVRYVRDLYELVDKEPRRYTVPLLWDKKKQTIVSNESADILRTLNTGFRELVPSNVDLVPADREQELNELNDGLIAELGAGYFGVLFAKDEEAKKAAEERGRVSLEKFDALLASKRYALGDSITEADVRAFHTLIRVDIGLTKENHTKLTQHENIVNYLRELYQNPALKATVYWDHLKVGLRNHRPDSPIAQGPFVDYEAPHNRANL